MTDYVIYELKNLDKSKEVKPFDFSAPMLGPVIFSNSLQMTCFENQWWGISAPQLGFYTRVIYVSGMESAMFNPKIVDTSDKKVYLEEISPSFSDVIIKVKRPEIIKVRWTDALNNTETSIFAGLTARVIQRKIDYLDSKDFFVIATKYHRDKALKNKNELRK